MKSRSPYERLLPYSFQTHLTNEERLTWEEAYKKKLLPREWTLKKVREEDQKEEK